MAFMFSHTMFNINQSRSKLFSMANYKHNILVLGIFFSLKKRRRENNNKMSIIIEF